MAGAQAAYSDPLRWQFQGSDLVYRTCGEPIVQRTESDTCVMKCLYMHRPTHDSQCESSKAYPFSWHLAERRRNWELRIQIQFKQLPKGQLWFGIELGSFVPLSLMAQQCQKALVTSVQKIVGDFYHSPGDDPAEMQGAEAELPAFVMPLWAFDQFLVSEAGEEPDLKSELGGMKRSDGVEAFNRALKALTRGFYTDNVYTFCFWGVSQFLDCINWEVTGALPGMRMDFDTLCGSPPIHLTMYDMPSTAAAADKRHLQSRKRYFGRMAIWSMLHPPPGMTVDTSVPAEEIVGGQRGPAHAAAVAQQPIVENPPPAAPVSMDLLDLGDAFGTGPKEAAPAAANAPPKSVETCDLLGLDL